MGFLIRFVARFWELFLLAGVALWQLARGWLTLERMKGWWSWYVSGPGWWNHTLAIIAFALTAWMIWDVLKYVVRLVYQLHWSRNLVCLKVTQPRQETHKDREEATEKDFREKIGVMEQLYRALHEISEMNLKNIIRSAVFETDLVSFELAYEKEKINFYVITNKYYAGVVEKQITSFYPDAYVEPVKDLPDPKPKGLCAKCFYFYQKKPNWRPFKTYKAVENDPLNSMTNVLSKLKADDRATIQLVIRPRKGSHLIGGWQKKARKALNRELLKKKKSFGIPGLGWLISLIKVLVLGNDSAISELGTNQPGANSGDPFTVRDQATDENLKHIGEKIAQPAFDTLIRIVGASDSEEAAEQITNGIATAFGMYKNEYLNWLQNRRMLFLDAINDKWMLFNFRKRLPIQGVWPISEKENLFVPEELASIFHLPTSRYNYTPLIEWLKYKILPPPVNLPKKEEAPLLIGLNKYRGETKEVRIKADDRTRHFYMIGKSGAGKSALISFMARQDIANGDGVGVVDPHGDLIEDILKYVPKERAKDVIVFNPADLERPMGLNLLEAKTPEEKDFASLAAMEIFIKLFGNEIFGPRIQHYFRNGCLTLMDDEEEGATLIDLPRLFTDEEFSQYKISKIKNPVVRSFWDREMAKTGAREKEEMIPYFSAKFGPFITNTMMRNIIGQKHSAFDFRKIMDEKKIILVNLSKGAVGDINAQLLGLIIVNKLQMAAMSRVDVPEDQRPNFWLYVDEFQNFATDAFATILSEARKYHLGLILAHQYIGQLTQQANPEGVAHEDPRIRDAVFGNVGTMMNFKIGATDAEYMAKEYAPLLSEQDVINIANYSAYIKLNVDNTTTRPFSISTIWDETGKNEKVAGLIKEYSRLKYGRKRAFVDQEISARIGIDLEAQLDAMKDKAFAKLPDELEKNPLAGAAVEKIDEKKVAAVEQAATEKSTKAS
ncbi:MAG: type IV secretion system DNA-binding domain-containing protein [Candidatus Peribacteraceae bacterium]|nr:type IV secretion system DNA-binding domain-containing protein [Candidatus Peribacteraceae bacterium]